MARQSRKTPKPPRVADDRYEVEAIRLRFWQAAHQLPYEAETGDRKSYRELEQQYGLDNGTFTKLRWGRLKRPAPSKARRIAEALRVSPEWLWEGRGQGPQMWHYVPPLPTVDNAPPDRVPSRPVEIPFYSDRNPNGVDETGPPSGEPRFNLGTRFEPVRHLKQGKRPKNMR